MYFTTALAYSYLPSKIKNKRKIIFIQKIRTLKEKFTKIKIKIKIIILGSLPIYPISERLENPKLFMTCLPSRKQGCGVYIYSAYINVGFNYLMGHTKLK